MTQTRAAAAASDVTSITVNGVPVYLRSSTEFSDIVDPETGESKFIAKTTWKLLSALSDGEQGTGFGRVTSSGTLLARLEELAETVQSIRSSATSNFARLRQLAGMTPAGEWPLEAEYKETQAKLADFKAKKAAIKKGSPTMNMASFVLRKERKAKRG